MTNLVRVFDQGDWVSYVLAVVSILLWSSVMLRAFALRGMRDLTATSPPRRSTVLARFICEARQLRHRPKRLEKLAERTKRELEFMRTFIMTMVAIAPLLGLLGTVIGMVEMFGSMQGTLNAAGESTVAGGISKALVTTQLGLVIAAPGLFASYMLSRQQLRRERDLTQVLRLLEEASC